MTKEPTNQDILDVLQAFAGSVDSRFEEINKRFEKIETTMVTKEYLDDKLFEVRGEIANLGRRHDRKLEIVVNELVKRNVFDDSTVARIMSV
jgi:hypothetical protein